MNKIDPEANGAALDTPRFDFFSSGLDRIRGWLASIHKTDAFCIALAIFVLAMSVPFYAFNRSADNTVSFHCQALFRSLPESVAAGSAETMLQLKQPPLKLFDEGLPSGIWCFSWTLILLTIWQGSCHCRVEQVFWCSLPLVLNMLWEIFQSAGVIAGSGNVFDCIFGFLGGSLAFLIHKSIRPCQEVLS